MKQCKTRLLALLCACALLLSLPAGALAAEDAQVPEVEAAAVEEAAPEESNTAAIEEEAVEDELESASAESDSAEEDEEPEQSAEEPVEAVEEPEEAAEEPEESGALMSAETALISTVADLNSAIKNAQSGAVIRVNTGALGGDGFIDIVSKNNLTLELGTARVNYKASSTYPYALRITGGSNITIRGGELVGGGIYVRSGARNVTIQGVAIRSALASGILVSESNLSCIENCTVDGAAKGFELYNASSVTGGITGNTISNIADKGILLTNKSANGKYVSKTGTVVNGSIANNTLTKVRGDGIGIYHGSHCGDITGNTLTDIGGAHNGYEGDYGIIIDSMIKEDTYAANVTNNTLTNVTYAGIVCYAGPNGDHANMEFQDTAYVAGNIAGNRLTNIGTYPHSAGWKKEKKKGCLSGIYVDTHACVKGNITNNVVDRVGEHGIYIHLVSWVRNITNNTVKNAKQDGIEVYTAEVKGDIRNNVIQKSGEHGISALNSSTLNKVTSNTITTTGMCGVYVDQSRVKGAVHGNKMTGVKKHGVNLSYTSSMGKVSSNTIATTGGKNSYGIRVTGKSRLPNITGNKLSGKMAYGLRMDQTMVNTSITKNQFKVSGTQSYAGIYLTGSPKLLLSVSGNTVVGNNTGYGICLNGGKANIVNNAVQKSTYPVNVVKKNVAVTVRVGKGKFRGNRVNQVRVASQKVVKVPSTIGKVRVLV